MAGNRVSAPQKKADPRRALRAEVQ